MDEKDLKKIYYLFFEKRYYIQDIVNAFKNKYTYNEIKKVIHDKIRG